MMQEVSGFKCILNARYSLVCEVSGNRFLRNKTNLSSGFFQASTCRDVTDTVGASAALVTSLTAQSMAVSVVGRLAICSRIM